MKKSLLFCVIISATTGALYAAVPPATSLQPTMPATTTAANADQAIYINAVAKVKTNLPVILATIKTLLPTVQTIANSAGGGFFGFIRSVGTAALDKGTQSAVLQLISTIGDTIGPVIQLANAPTNVKQDVRGLLTAFTNDNDVKQLMSSVQKVPVVGNTLYDQLKELINKINKI